MRRRRLAPLLFAAGVGLAALACSSSDGRELPPPRVPQTTTLPTTPVIAPSEGSVGVFRLSSPSFADRGEMPAHFTCRADQATSPALAWTGTPLEAASLALVVRDLNAGGFVHWVVTDIDPFVQSVGEGGLPENAIEHLNSTGAYGWAPACPPAGTGVHSYEFAVLALAEKVVLPLDASANQAATAIETAAIERAVLTGTVAAE